MVDRKLYKIRFDCPIKVPARGKERKGKEKKHCQNRTQKLSKKFGCWTAGPILTLHLFCKIMTCQFHSVRRANFN